MPIKHAGSACVCMNPNKQKRGWAAVRVGGGVWH